MPPTHRKCARGGPADERAKATTIFIGDANERRIGIERDHQPNLQCPSTDEAFCCDKQSFGATAPENLSAIQRTTSAVLA